ncbi:hypothetical protein ACHAXR_008585 [Thalassiosira sp. AJA248-18]
MVSLRRKLDVAEAVSLWKTSVPSAGNRITCNSERLRLQPHHSPSEDASGSAGITRPATAIATAETPTENADDGEEEDILDEGTSVDDNEVDSYELTRQDIEFIRASFAESLHTHSGRTPLQCDSPPKIDEILNRYQCVIGDVFHAMDRAKVPVKHFVTLREAFFSWDQDMMKDLERRMRAGGMTDEDIKKSRHFNAGWSVQGLCE